MRRLARRLGLVALLAGVLLLATAAVVAADTGNDGVASPPSGIQHGNQPLDFEKYPTSAYQFTIEGGRTIDGLSTLEALAGGSMGDLSSLAAEIGMTFIAMIGAATTSLLEWTFSADLIQQTLGQVGGGVQALKSGFYEELLPTVIVLVAAWAGYQAIVQKRVHAARESVLWAVFAVIAGSVYMAVPAQIVDAADGFTTALSKVLLGGIALGDPQIIGRSGDARISQGDPTDAELREAADRWHLIFVRDPYYLVEFGNLTEGQRFGPELLAKNAGQPSNFDADFGANASTTAHDWYQGRHGFERLGWVLLALVVVLTAGLMLLLNVATVFIAALGVVFLAIAGPIALVVGPLPWKGRDVLERWFWAFLAALAVKVVVGAELGIVLVLSGVAAHASQWVLAVLWEGALLWLALRYRKPFVEVFTTVLHPRRYVEQQQWYQDVTARGHEWLESMRGSDAPPVTEPPAAGPAPGPASEPAAAAPPASEPPAAAAAKAETVTTAQQAQAAARTAASAAVGSPDGGAVAKP
jgi:hypothetical protein